MKFSVSYHFFVHNQAQKKMPRKNFMKSWLTYHAKNSEIKMYTATNILSCNISKILCKVRYTRLDTGICRKLLSTGMFSAPYLMLPDEALQTLLGKGFVMNMIWIRQGLVCGCWSEFYNLHSGTPGRTLFWS